MTEFNFAQARRIVTRELTMQRTLSMEGAAEVLSVPLMLGPVGSGKTSLAREMAETFSLPLLTINCGECSDASEFGLPVPSLLQTDECGTFMQWALNEVIHTACREPVLLLFDDIDKAPAIVEGALLGIFGKRSLRERFLHKETLVMGAGNREQDDTLARRLSESLRTRATPFEYRPTVDDFVAYNNETNEIHPALMGFLRYKPQFLSAKRDDILRFPTLRGWAECSRHLNTEKDDADWATIVELKCGVPVAQDFMAWYTIVRKVDVKKILTEGTIEYTAGAGEDNGMIQYAAIFAVVSELNSSGVSKKHKGLLKFVEELHPELRVAFAVQLNKAARTQLKSTFPVVAGTLLSDIVT